MRSIHSVADGTSEFNGAYQYVGSVTERDQCEIERSTGRTKQKVERVGGEVAAEPAVECEADGIGYLLARRAQEQDRHWWQPAPSLFFQRSTERRQSCHSLARRQQQQQQQQQWRRKRWKRKQRREF